MNIDFDSRLLYGLACMAGTAAVLAIIVGTYVFTSIRRINLPPDADTLTALRMTPLSVVVLLDLLDMALDIFAAPFAWIILTRLGLGPLRGVTVAESLIPGTGAIPTMTAAWVLARFFRPEMPRRMLRQ